VAAVVLGGVASPAAAGNVLGVVATAVILIMLNPILTAMGINSNNAQVIQGVLIAGVMMIGGLVVTLLSGESVMSQSNASAQSMANQKAASARSPAAGPASPNDPTIVLVGVLIILVLADRC
jgi:hypothetical protein